VIGETKDESACTKMEHLQPSAKLVSKVLESGDLLTQKDIITKTQSSTQDRKVCPEPIEGAAVLQERFYFPDARQSLYGPNAPSLEAMTA
jgi:hypothetical protein